MKKFILLVCALVSAASLCMAQQIPALPNDPATKVGKLDNGMTYYIRHNALPEKRAEFYLATNVGANQETPDQDGLAHFLEHMCFNGTKNFPGKDLLNWLQSIGASFGGNVNAATGTEQTQYMLNNIPLTRPSVIDSCLLIMHDYSHFVTLDPKEIDAERGVILEEKRTRNEAGWRTYMESKKYLFKGSKLAETSLIGSEENLKNFKPASLENFYKTWYRPDMQALVVVGDIDVDEVEAKVKEIFSDIPAAENPTPKNVNVVPGHEEPVIGVYEDAESTNTSVVFYWESDATPKEYNNTAIGLMNELLQSITSIAMNERFTAICAQPDAPIIGGGMGVGRICEGTEAAIMQAACKNGEALKAAETIMIEAEKLRRYGLSDDEVKRAKDEILSQYESASKKADTRKNSEFISPIINNFFYNDYYMDPVMAYQVVQSVLPQLTPAVVNKVAQEYITKENLVVIVAAPKKDGLVNPTDAQILEVIRAVEASDIQANVAEEVPEAFLDASKLKGSAVKSSKTGLYGSTEYTLKNGVNVILMPSSIEKDRIQIRLFKKGGKSLVDDADLYSLEDNVFSLYQANTGVSQFAKTTVDKMLSGKQVYVNPLISNYTHGVTATTTAKDLETALQLVYLFVTDPRFDQNEFDQGISQIKAVLPNLVSTSNYKLQEQRDKTIYDSPRRFTISEEVLAKANLQTLEKVYRNLFKDAAGTTVVIAGDFKNDEVLPLAQKYFGSFKKGGKASNWSYRNDGIVSGEHINDFTAVMEQPKVTVLQVYTDHKPFSAKREASYDALSYILRMIYTDTMREEEGGTYGARAGSSVSDEPNPTALLQVSFDTNEDQVERLRELAVDGIEKLATEGPSAEYFDRAAKYYTKKIPEDRLRIAYWTSLLQDNVLYGRGDYDSQYEAAVKALTADDVKAVAAEILSSGNKCELVMRPQK